MFDFRSFFLHLTLMQAAVLAAQLMVIAYAVIWMWRRIVGTQAEYLVKGVLVLIGACLASRILGFMLIASVLETLIPIAVIALLIVFQPEIRRGLGQLGRMDSLHIDISLANSEAKKSTRDIDQIISAVRELSRAKVGALIVVESSVGDHDYLSPGTAINADISASLLLSIFFPNSPLHDGAVVIRRHKVVAAGVILPITDNQKLSQRYGTRHRAALGLSEIYDGMCIVISEESGLISAANKGMLITYNNADDLRDSIAYFCHQPVDNKMLNAVGEFLGRLKKNVNTAVESPKPEEAVPKPEGELEASA